jgi:hypothetical protein
MEGRYGGDMAVIQLDVVRDVRMLHVAKIALNPTAEWHRGDLIIEVSEIDLPDHLGPGLYDLLVGSYDSNEPYAYTTDERSRIV